MDSKERLNRYKIYTDEKNYFGKFSEFSKAADFLDYSKIAVCLSQRSRGDWPFENNIHVY